MNDFRVIPLSTERFSGASAAANLATAQPSRFGRRDSAATNDKSFLTRMLVPRQFQGIESADLFVLPKGQGALMVIYEEPNQPKFSRLA